MDNNLITINDVVVKREGRSFKFEVAAKITEDQACELQGNLCYHPAGYGFYGFESTPTKTTWFCSDSSD